MIGILQNKHLTRDKLDKIEKSHLKNFKTLLDNEKKGRKKEKIEKLEIKLSKVIGINDFEEIAIADYNRLLEIKNVVDKINYKTYKISFNNLKKIFNSLYTKYRKTYARQLVEDLEITVCPYCNRNFINNTEKYAMAQFDHFFQNLNTLC